LTQEKDAVMGVFTVPGFSFAARGQASGLVFIRMKDWRERPGKKNRVQAVAARANAALGKISDAQAFAFAPPAALELGNATGSTWNWWTLRIKATTSSWPPATNSWILRARSAADPGASQWLGR